MLIPVLAAVASIAVGLFVYLSRERLGVSGLALAGLRATGLTALAVLILNPSRVVPLPAAAPTVLLDGSLSMMSAGSHWRAALDTARAIAGRKGTILQFGAGTAPFDTLARGFGKSEMRGALAAVVEPGSPVTVVTDGEISDAAAIPRSLLARVSVVTLPRDTFPNLALEDVSFASAARERDSVRFELTILAQGPVDPAGARIEILEGSRRLLTRRLGLPAQPGRFKREIWLPPESLHEGDHVLSFALRAPGDSEPGDDVRMRVVHVTSQPGIVVVVDPAGWEGRFLVSELRRMARSPVQGFAKVQPDRWIDLETQAQVPENKVRDIARSAGLVVVRGSESDIVPGSRAATWLWPAGSDRRVELFEGDWYLTPKLGSSPLAGRLARIAWDSLPPLTGVVPLVPGTVEWVALTAREGRRGAERPVLLGSDTAGVRRLVTAASGLWRWSFRGGSTREAYRALLAAGVNWLMRTDEAGLGERKLLVSNTVPFGAPVVLRWSGSSAPDSITLRITGPDSSFSITRTLGPRGEARVLLPPGGYRWRNPETDETGLVAVESYSPEYTLQPATLRAGRGNTLAPTSETNARQTWWWFVIVAGAFVGEWFLRQRKGLP